MSLNLTWSQVKFATEIGKAVFTQLVTKYAVNDRFHLLSVREHKLKYESFNQ